MIDGTSAARRACAVDGCDRVHLARGYCKLHYYRWKKWGDPTRVGSRYGRIDLDAVALQRFWAKVDQSGNCWIWTGGKYRNGNGVFCLRGDRVLAHRWIYERTVGPIGDGMDLRSVCGEQACVRPDHRKPVTRRENVLTSRITEFSRRSPTCKHGHAFTPENTRLLPSGRRRCVSCERDAEYRWRRKQLGYPADELAAATKVDRIAVFERDSWICGICGDVIEPTRCSPDPMSPSLDHTIPLARGGAHSYANVQAAHLVCNLRKGDRLLL